MATNVSATVYYETGFDSVNVPDSIGLLSSCRKEYIPNVTLRSIDNLSSIDLNLTSSDAPQADYVVFTGFNRSVCYFVTAVSAAARAGTVYTLYLSMDGITTVGMFSRKSGAKVTGWMTRGHKSLAEVGSINKAAEKILSEPFTPNHGFREDYDDRLLGVSIGGSKFIESTVDLSEIVPVAKDYVSEENNFVTVPMMPKPERSTKFTSNVLGGEGITSIFDLPFTSIYNGDSSVVVEGVNIARSLGIDGAIQSSYSIPKTYVPSPSGEFLEFINGNSGVASSSLSLIPGYDPINKKAALLHQRITLSSNVSGDSSSYALSQIGTGMRFKWFVDPGPKGRPYCRPEYVDGNGNPMYGAVMGNQWENSSLGFNNASGSTLDAINYKRGRIGKYASLAIDASKTIAAGATAFATGGVVGTGSAISGSGDVVSGVADLVNSKREYNESINLQLPEIQFAMSEGIQNYVGNDFTITRTMLKDDDIRRFDEFLHMFGEATSEKYSIDKAYTRSSYNFVELDRVFLDSPMPRRIREVAIAQASGGVRVWHTLPNDNALKLGGN